MKRLQAIGEFVPDGSVLVDVGTDHAYLIVDLLLKGKIPYAYGIDINEKPLSYARKHVEDFGLEKQVELILADGLKNFKKEADVFVIAGLGGETIIDIIDGYCFNENQRIIIQANTKWTEVRKAMMKRGFRIIDENFLIERSIPALIIAYEQGEEKLDEKDFVLGPILSKKENNEYHQYLQERYDHLKEIHHFKEALHKEFLMIEAFLKQKEG